MTSDEQHLAVRRAAGLFDFSFMGLYEFDDVGALQELQSRTLSAMSPGHIVYTLLLAADGAVIIDATVWRFDTQRFGLFAGRRAAYGGRDRSGELAILALQGPASGRILAALVGAGIVCDLRYFHFTQVGDMLIGRIGYSGELGYELLVPAAEEARLRAELVKAGSREGLVECGWDAANSLRQECGYVLFDREVDGKANPRELGLERLVDRQREFGLTRKLVGLEILDEAGDAGLPVAQVTSECFSPVLQKRIALAFVPPALTNDARVRARERTARIARLPFYDPERRRPRAAPL